MTYQPGGFAPLSPLGRNSLKHKNWNCLSSILGKLYHCFVLFFLCWVGRVSESHQVDDIPEDYKNRTKQSDVDLRVPGQSSNLLKKTGDS